MSRDLVTAGLLFLMVLLLAVINLRWLEEAYYRLRHGHWPSSATTAATTVTVPEGSNVAIAVGAREPFLVVPKPREKSVEIRLSVEAPSVGVEPLGDC